MPAGYSGTPLVKKLGFKPGMRVRLIDVPKEYGSLVGKLPEGVRLIARTQSPLDLIHVFVTGLAVLAKTLPTLRRALASDGMIWVSWPKQASKVKTDVTEDEVRRLALKIGLVDIKVCAVDEMWSGLKLVIPLKDR